METGEDTKIRPLSSLSAQMIAAITAITIAGSMFEILIFISDTVQT